jgi:uncharacterized RDD family membrane protein YckC
MEFSMDDLNAKTAESAEAVDYAGFWVRLWAWIIDSIIVLLVTAPALIFIYGWEYYDFDDETYGFIAGPADILISFGVPFFATVWMWTKYKATPGKMLFSLKIVKADTGAALTLKESVVRYFAYFAAAIPLCIGFFWVAFDSKKQGWHDKIAGTVVVRSKQRGTELVRFPQA